jgi:hypothetical protein
VFSRRLIAVALLGGLTSLSASASQAVASVTVGQLAPGVPQAYCSGSVPYDGVQPTVTSGNSFVVPGKGVITAWSNKSGPDSGQTMTFKVYRPLGGQGYMVVGHDGPRPLQASALNTFTTAIPVQSGDVIGLHYGETSALTACNFDATDTYLERSGDLADGQFGNFPPYAVCCFYRLNVTALVEPTSSFTLGKVVRNNKRGIATVTANVPNPGDLSVSGKGVKDVSAAGAVSAKSVSPGAATLTIKSRGKQKRILESTGKVKVRPVITYTPTGGEPTTQVLKLKLRKG